MLKISNPQRIARIMQRVCHASLRVILRSRNDHAVSVKGRAAACISQTDGSGLVRISNISELGIQHLRDAQTVQVEFVMMAAKVMFVSRVKALQENTCLLSMPTVLLSLERRKNARFATSTDLSAFVQLSIWTPASSDPAAPPIFPLHNHMAGRLHVADISLGGMCLVSRFPAVNNALKRGIIDDGAKLYLPMQVPVGVGLEVRWVKKIREHTQTEATAYQRTYRFGVEFLSQTEEAKQSLRMFFQQVSQAGAI
jgi:c-di-GMP-binding flagellar brake protein YcgR